MQLFYLVSLLLCVVRALNDLGLGFDLEFASTAATLSSLAYCMKDDFIDRNQFSKSFYTEGFTLHHTIYDKMTDTNAFIGLRKIDMSIYIVFKGSTSHQDWINDLDMRLLPYSHCENCYVHEGFYTAEKV